ncbi:MAG: hypothetical protein Q9220_003315 [cf. Caloplaca sp. 1 TL-2023]
MMIIGLDTATYPVAPADGISPCADGAGVVEKVGEGSVWKRGERVMVHPTAWIEGGVETVGDIHEIKAKGAENVEGLCRGWMEVGMMGEGATGYGEDSHLLHAPDHLTFEELAALPVAGGTAINTLFYGPRELKKGMTVLTQGTGAVSCAVIQIASACGATVIATSSSDEKLVIAKSLGATHGINYQTHRNWENEVLRLTEGKGVDHAVEIGGAQSIEQSMKATTQGGLISLVGILSEDRPVSLVGPLLFKAQTMIVRAVFSMSRPMEEDLVRIVDEHKLRPAIAKVFEWKDAKEAFEYSLQWSGVGKVVIKVGD